MKSLIVLIVVGLCFASCKKAEDRRCFKFLGEEKTIEVELEDFDKLILNAHLEYILVQDSTDKLVITGGENVVNLVEWEIDNDKILTISNGNKCNFLRNERKVIKVEIHYTNVYNIRFEGTEPLTTKGTLKTDYFVLLIRDGAGPVTMDLDCISVNADISHGWGDYTFTGTTDYAYLAARSNGFCDTRGLSVSTDIYVASETSGTIKVNCGNLNLKGHLKSNGDIEYIGNPSSVNVLNTGTGKVIDLD